MYGQVIIMKRLFLRSFWFRIILESLALWAGVVILALLLYWRVSSLQRFYFSDLLFIAGLLECALASAGLMRSPYDITDASTYGAPAHPVQPSDDERRFLAVANYVRQRTFAFRLLAAGLLTILLSLALTFFFPLIKGVN